MKLIYNVVGRIDGAIEPDRYVIIGGHRDSWMFGSVDALSSQTCLIEIVRGFCALKNQGNVDYIWWVARCHAWAILFIPDCLATDIFLLKCLETCTLVTHIVILRQPHPAPTTKLTILLETSYFC